MGIFTSIRCIGGKYTFPFAETGDSQTKMYELSCICDPDDYVPGQYDDTMATAANAGVDQLPTNFSDANAFWAKDTPLETFQGALVRFTRIFVNRPQTRVEPSGFYATTFPSTDEGDAVSTFTPISATISHDTANLRALATVVRSQPTLASAGVAITRNWLYVGIINGKPAWDDNGPGGSGAGGLNGDDRLWWNGASWVIRTNGRNRYSSSEDVFDPTKINSWTILPDGGGTPTPSVFFNGVKPGVGQQFVINSISFRNPFSVSNTSTNRGRFRIVNIVDNLGPTIVYTLENPEYYYLKNLQFTSSTPNCDMIYSVDRDSGLSTINASSFRRYEYVKSNDPLSINLKKADFLTPLAYGTGDYERFNAYSVTTTPDADLYKAFVASRDEGALVLAEDQTLRRWFANIYEIESILVNPL